MSADPLAPGGYLRIPKLLKTWPWHRKINPFHKEVAVEGIAWLYSLKPFNAKSQRAFDKCGVEHFAALMLPSSSQAHLRVGLDFLYLFFVIDEYTDVQPAPVVRQMMDVCLDALHNPHKPRPEGESILGEMTRQFWEHALVIATEQGAKHFVACFSEYLHSVVVEAEARDRGGVLSLDAYLDIRQVCVGVHSCYAIFELALDLPDELIYDPDMVEMTRIGCELISIDNDILSYNREQACGTSNFSFVTVVMRGLDLDHNDAIDWLTERAVRLEKEYMARLASVTSRPTGDGRIYKQLSDYVEHMGNLRRCVWAWSFESGRYFGEMGSQVAELGRVPLIPQKAQRRGSEMDVVLIEEELAQVQSS